MYSSRNGQEQHAGRCSRWYTRDGCYPMNRQWLTNWVNHGTLAREKNAEICGPTFSKWLACFPQ